MNDYQIGGGFYGDVCIYINTSIPINNLDGFIDYLVNNISKLDPAGATSLSIDIDEEGKDYVKEVFKISLAGKNEIQNWFPKNMEGQLYKICYNNIKYASDFDLLTILNGAKGYFNNANFIAGILSGDMDEILGESGLTIEELEKIQMDNLWINPKAVTKKQIKKTLGAKKSQSAPINIKKVASAPVKKQIATTGMKKCNKKSKKNDTICNPKSGRWVAINGKIGKDLIAEFGLDFIMQYSNSMI